MFNGSKSPLCKKQKGDFIFHQTLSAIKEHLVYAKRYQIASKSLQVVNGLLDS